MTFFPPIEHKTGTVFIVFCLPGYLPLSAYGTMICDEIGGWQNAPECGQENITPQETSTSKPVTSHVSSTMFDSTTVTISDQEMTQLSTSDETFDLTTSLSTSEQTMYSRSAEPMTEMSTPTTTTQIDDGM